MLAVERMLLRALLIELSNNYRWRVSTDDAEPFSTLDQFDQWLYGMRHNEETATIMVVNQNSVYDDIAAVHIGSNYSPLFDHITMRAFACAPKFIHAFGELSRLAGMAQVGQHL